MSSSSNKDSSYYKRGLPKSLNEYLSIVFGIVTIISFALTTKPFYVLIWHSDFTNLSSEATAIINTVPSLLVTICVLSASIFLLYFFHSRSLKVLYETVDILPYENHLLEKQLAFHKTLLNVNSEGAHNVIHHSRYLSLQLDNFLLDLERDDASGMMKNYQNIFNSCHDFFMLFTANMASIFTYATKDTCAVTIKLINDNKIKTYFRDPLSYRKRSNADEEDSKDRIYKASDNSAYLEIIDADKGAFFVANDLSEMDGYRNRGINYEKNKFYNATLVMPVRARDIFSDDSSKYHINALLCIDNKRGGFSFIELVDLASTYADLLYEIMIKINIIADYAKQNGDDNAQIQKWSYWG